jgi:pimeloyl-ACP methyl ester carboxylesterase
MRVSILLPIFAATITAAIPVKPLSAQAGAVLPQRPLEPCKIDRVPGEVLCGTFTVFEDREARSGRTIDLRVVVLRATGEQRVMDPVVPLAGGPGGSATAGARGYAQQYVEERHERDILLVDQRGAGQSNPLHCSFPAPRGETSFFGSLFPTDHITMCRDKLSERADLSLYGTPLAADDLEDVRKWLEYDRLNLMGGSYGTRIAQVFMRRHPQSVRTAVLNALVPLGRNPYFYGATSIDQGLEQLFSDCAADTNCVRAFPNFREQFAAVVARFDHGPVQTDVQLADGTTKAVGFTLGDFAYAVRGVLYSAASNRLPLAIRDAHDSGDLGLFARYYLQRIGWVTDRGTGTGMHFSILCSEDMAFNDWEELRGVTEGTLMGAHLIREYESACDAWETYEVPANYHDPLRSDVPTLLLSGERDPITPPAYGEEVAQYLSRSLHVVQPNAGHGAGGLCVAQLRLQLITTGSVEGLDPSCIRPTSKPDFVIP